MCNNKTLLTIAIPTYDRPDEIVRQVRLLLPQLTKEVKLVVRDNASPIPVEELFEDSEKSKFEIIRNKVNLGGDANIARCHECCGTTWLWTLGDDDFIKTDAVATVLRLIMHSPQNTLMINVSTGEDKKLTDKESVLNNLSDFMSFGDSFWISKCIYNESLLRSHLNIYYQSLSSMIGQFAYFLSGVMFFNDYTFVKSSINIFETTNIGGWNTKRFIIKNWAIVNQFSGILEKKDYAALKRIISNYDLILLNRNIETKYRLMALIIKRHGFFRSMCDFPLKIVKKLVLFILPNMIITGIKGKRIQHAFQSISMERF